MYRRNDFEDDRQPPGVTYVLLVAQHTTSTERLVVQDADGYFYLWVGDPEFAGLDPIEPELAHWIMDQALVHQLDTEVWVHVDDLPSAPAPAGGRR